MATHLSSEKDLLDRRNQIIEQLQKDPKNLMMWIVDPIEMLKKLGYTMDPALETVIIQKSRIPAAKTRPALKEQIETRGKLGCITQIKLKSPNAKAPLSAVISTATQSATARMIATKKGQRSPPTSNSKRLLPKVEKIDGINATFNMKFAQKGAGGRKD